jgi:hypothetical protein
MDKIQVAFWKDMVTTLQRYNEEKKAEGFIPTIELLIEDLQEQIEKHGN